MYVYDRNFAEPAPPPKKTLVDELREHISKNGRSDVEARVDEERSNLGRTVVMISENHSGETRSVDLVRRLLKNDAYRFVASEYFLNAGPFRLEIRNFMRGLLTSLGGLLCPYKSLFNDLRLKPRFMLFIGSRSENSNERDHRIAQHFIEEHADRKLKLTTPGVLVCGTIHGARVAQKGQFKTMRRRLEEAGFKILGVMLATDDIDRANIQIQLRTDTVWPVGETQTDSNKIRLLDLVSTNSEYTVVPTKNSPLNRITDVWNGDSAAPSIADRYELLILAKKMTRPCPRS